MHKAGSKGRWLLVCLLLVGWLALAAHALEHPLGEAPTDHQCLLCQLAQSPALPLTLLLLGLARTRTLPRIDPTSRTALGWQERPRNRSPPRTPTP